MTGPGAVVPADAGMGAGMGAGTGAGTVMGTGMGAALCVDTGNGHDRRRPAPTVGRCEVPRDHVGGGAP
ncbi:hypothetical protein [Streptomyces sp. NPDC056405]|uniref:hypothetical protein n=1 Tax=Streptomyces sp. NPDC056405 TaxID=3345811 RepID=UPI0035D943DB